MDPKINLLAKRFLDATVNQRWGLDKEAVLDVLNDVRMYNEISHYYPNFKNDFKQAVYNRLDLTRHKEFLTKGKESIVNAILLEKADVPFFKKASYVFNHRDADHYDMIGKMNNYFSFFSFLGLDPFIYDYDALVKE